MKAATDPIFSKVKDECEVSESLKRESLIRILKGEEEFILDSNGIVISSNLEAVNVTGYEEYEVVGKHISMFYLPEESNKAKMDLERATRLAGTIVTGMRLKKRGVAFWAKMKINLIGSETTVPRFKVVLQDTTHRELSKDRFNTLRDEYLTLFNNPFVGTFKFRIDNFHLLSCNSKALSILKCQKTNDISFEDFFENLEQFHQFIDLLKEEKKVEGFKFLIRDDSSENGNWGLLSARYFEKKGFVEGILLDISEQYGQMLELQRVNSELDRITYHASHDLRSPLTSIMGLVNLAKKEPSAAKIQTYLDMVKGRAEQLDSLLKDIISISYNNTASNSCESFSIADEVQLILKSLNVSNPVQVNFECKVNCEFETDPIRMRAILRCLLSNAFRYTNVRSKPPQIDILIKVEPSHCAIKLKDNGTGIRQEIKNKVYDIFFRGTERSTGSGLGLYIVKTMLEKLNGKISFDSTVDVGTTFLVTIPNRAPRILASSLVKSSVE
jgi:PAS domain S-box-containing protein